VDWFRDTNSDFKADAFAEDLRRKHYEFYKRCVLPFVEESVDYELLACFDPAPTRREIALAAEFGGIPGKRPALWTSHKLTLLKAEPFAAVGCGAVTAKALLTKFWGFVDATGGCN
jgi:hypothetical protein